MKFYIIKFLNHGVFYQYALHFFPPKLLLVSIPICHRHAVDVVEVEADVILEVAEPVDVVEVLTGVD
jgi:hypothetical protein